MRILYDSLGFEEPWGGVPRYLVELLRHLPGDCVPGLAVAGTPHAALQAPPFGIPPARQCVAEFCPGISFPGKRRLYLGLARTCPWLWPSAELANARLFARMLRGGGFDVLHLTAPHRYGRAWRKAAGRVPIVVTVHDLIPERVLGDARTRAERAAVLAAASGVIAVSRATRDDLVRTYGLDGRKIAVVHHGVDSGAFVNGDGPRGAGDFLLYVGKRDGYKNWAAFVRQAAPWVCGAAGRGIVCVGSPFRADERRALRALGLEGRAEARSATDAELKSLYRTAFAYVCPSTHEGFGLPVLEAMAAGCPAVLSDIPVMREVGGDAALYFSGGEALGAALATLRHPGARDEFVGRGVVRARSFTWERCARETAEVYRRAAARARNGGGNPNGGVQG